MALFSSKKKVVVNVTIQKVFEESMIPDSARQGVVKGVLNSGNVVDYMLEDLANSVGVRANTALAWAKKNDYFFGIPASQTRSNVDAKTIVLNVIATNAGKAITPVYYTMGPMNSLHYAWSWLVNVHGYNPETNELVGITATEGKKCYLKDMIATYTRESYDFMVQTNDLGMVDQLGPSPSSGYTPSNPFTALQGIGPYDAQPAYEVSDVAVEDYVTITYEYESEPGVFVTHGLTLSLSAVDLTADFHQCRYKGADGKTGFFTYMQGSGTYPIIDQVFSIEFEPLGSFYPWTYFRVAGDRVKYGDPKGYTDAKKYCDYLGVNYDLLDEKVAEDPDVIDVQQSMLLFALKPGEKHPACMEYLYKHFSLLHAATTATEVKANVLDEKFYNYTTSPSQIQVVQDKFFTATFQYSGIAKRRLPGSIGIKGTYNSEYSVVGQSDQRFFVNGTTGVTEGSAPVGQPAWIYRYQVTDSVYEEVAVFGLRADYAVHNKKGYGAGATSDELLIPIDREIMRTIGLSSKEQVLCRGLQFFVSTATIIKTPWYASGPFKIVMLIVAVVITVLSLGTAWQTIVAAAALGATAIAITVLTYIVSALVISYGVKLFIKKFGPQVGIIAAIAAMAIGAYGASSNAAWGETLVSIGTNLSTQSVEAFKVELNEIMMDIQNFQEYAKGAFNDLEEAKDNLGLDGFNAGLEPLEMVYRIPDIRIGEVPDDFYNRTVHSGNIGVTSYDMVSNFVSTKLTLPTLADNQDEEVDNGLAI